MAAGGRRRAEHCVTAVYREPRTTQRVPDPEPLRPALGRVPSGSSRLFWRSTTHSSARSSRLASARSARANYFLGILRWADLARGLGDQGRRVKDESSFLSFRLSSFVFRPTANDTLGCRKPAATTRSGAELFEAGRNHRANPPRLIAGGYGVWQDLRRERAILATLSGVNAALVGQVQAVGAPIFTDVQAWPRRRISGRGCSVRIPPAARCRAGRPAAAAARHGSWARAAGSARLPG